jgi:tetratricopeptide (TPR) repeat protein/serine/threonine protein kinase
MDERSIFMAALERESPPERSAYLEKVCGGDTALRQRVEALLDSHEQAGSFLRKPVPERLADRILAPEQMEETSGEAGPAGELAGALPEGRGSRIGPYKLLQEISEGGMGTVFLAEQSEPVRRLVALKIIKPGMDSRQVIARFEAERQALALMEHPNIARVLDGGTTASGRPFFVMELVKGVPITRFCDERRLTPRQRLELFVPVCQAVQHAHQKGIIHRDLKPSNVLVCLYDGKPVPKVIDFGVAKATGQKLTERTLYTEIGQVVGTLEYMSPEQAELNQLDIDTRSDIYSLGVLLYELLTGSTPLDRKRLKATAMLEMLRIIREEEPPKPSTRLSSTEEMPSIAANRGLEPKRLSGLLRGELDWIVMKALEKNRNRRYETASAFAADVQRFLADEPVQACPPSVGYRLRKFARRNRARLAIAAGALLTLAVMAASIGWAVRDRLEREAERRRVESTRRQQVADKVGGSWNLARALLAENRIAAALQKLVEAQTQLGNDQSALADLAPQVESGLADLRRLDRFLDLIDRAQEVETAPVREAASGTGGFLGRAGLPARAPFPGRRPARAVPLVLQALDCFAILERDDCSAFLGAGLQGSQQVEQVRRAAYEQLLWLADDVVKRQEEHRSGERLSPQAAATAALRYVKQAENAHPPTRAFYALRAGCYKALGETDAYEADRQRAEKVAPTLALDDHLRGVAAFDAGKYEEAAKAFESALLREPTHYWSLMRLGYSLFRLGLDHDDRGAIALAVTSFTGCILRRPEHGMAYACRGQSFSTLGRYDQAVADLSRALELDPNDDFSWSHRAIVWNKLGQHEKALADDSRAVALNPKDAMHWSNRGLDQGSLGHAEKALVDYNEAIKLDPSRSIYWSNRGDAYRALGQFDKAIADFSKAIALDSKNPEGWAGRGVVFIEKRDPPEKALPDLSRAITLDPTNVRAWFNRGKAHIRLVQPDKAIADYSKAIELDPKHALAWAGRGVVYCDYLGQARKAIDDFSEAIKLDPKDKVMWFNRGVAYSNLGQHDRAIANFSEAAKLDSKLDIALYCRGEAYACLNQLDKAIADYSSAIDLAPKSVNAWYRRGRALLRLGRPESAIADFTQSIALKPDFVEPWYFRGNTYLKLGEVEKAFPDLNQAIALKPEYAQAHCDLGHTLRRRGEFRQALEEMRRGHDLGSRYPGWREPSAQWIVECQHLVELEETLPGILKGTSTPASQAERLELFEICLLKGFNRAAVGLYQQAAAAEPRLADDPDRSHRYNAACGAARAGCGQDKEVEKLDDAERARLRRQALEWLRADLETWRRLLDREAEKSRSRFARQMRVWLDDPDFVGVRVPAALAKLPDAERIAWQELWGRVSALLAEAGAKEPESESK